MSSITTIANTTTSRSGPVSGEAAQLRNWSHLADYELHHSNTPSTVPATATDPIVPRPLTLVEEEPGPLQLGGVLQSPQYWPNNHRRIPAYRAINRDLDQSQRRVYTSTGERVFLTVMFTGVQTNAVRNQHCMVTFC